MTGTQVVAKAQHGAKDFEQGLKAIHGRQTLEYQASLVLALGVIAWSAYDRFRGGNPALAWIWDAVLFATFAGWLWLSVRARRKTAARLAADETGETTFRFSVDSVVCVDPLTGTDSKWTRFTRVLETADLYVMEARGGSATFVPKRAFATPEDEAAFRRLVELAGLRIAKP